jgi:hypothetical protein
LQSRLLTSKQILGVRCSARFFFKKISLMSFALNRARPTQHKDKLSVPSVRPAVTPIWKAHSDVCCVKVAILHQPRA